MSRLEAALALYDEGKVPVLLHGRNPFTGLCTCGNVNCVGPAKRPQFEGWSKLRPSREEVEEWFDKNPDANLGMLCGKVSNVVVLDIDKRKGGFASFNRLKNVPKTRIVKTGGGGFHYHFLYPNNGAVVDTKTVIPDYPGLEIRSDGAQVVMPPSIHISGNEYTWDNGLPMAVWPLDLIPIPKKAPLGAPPAIIPEGERHSTLLQHAGWLRAHGYSPSMILALLREMNRETCKPPHDDDDILRIARDSEGWAVRDHLVAEIGNAGAPGTVSDTAYADAAILGSDLLAMNIEKPKSILGDGLLIAGTIGQLYGKPGLGKSFLLMDMALCLSQGEPWLGIPTTQTNTAIFCLEIMRYHMKERLKAISGGSEHGLKSIALLARDDIPVRVNLADPHCMVLFEAMIKRFDLGCLIIDPLSRAQPGDVAKDVDMGPVMDNLDVLSAQTKCCIVIGHHDRKSQSGNTRKDDELDAAKGSGRLSQDPNLMIHVSKHDKLVRLAVTKSNFGIVPDPIWLRRLETGRLTPTEGPDDLKKLADTCRSEILGILKLNAGTPLSLAEIWEIGQFLDSAGKPRSNDSMLRYVKWLCENEGVLATGARKDRRYLYPARGVETCGTNTQVVENADGRLDLE